jgi:hypothetical protein
VAGKRDQAEGGGCRQGDFKMLDCVTCFPTSLGKIHIKYVVLINKLGKIKFSKSDFLLVYLLPRFQLKSGQ